MKTPQVIFEDDYMLALNKPTGWVVNDAATVEVQTLQDWIEQNYNFELAKNRQLRSGIVHRLDKPTSGIILVAKKREIFDALQKQFADREINKVYVALVHKKRGHGPELAERGTINEKIGRLPWKRTKFGVFEGGREAVTNYKVINSSPEYSLLELYPKTGRTHQLRVHLQHIGNPVVGDHLYAGRKTARVDLKQFGRLMLHARSIEFTHPITKKLMHLESPLPKEFEIDIKQ